MPATPPLSLAGRTQRWKFGEGPTAGKTYEHAFYPDGTVSWREVEGTSKGKPSADQRPTTRYAAFEVAPGLHLVSYLSESGYTLTVLVNTNNRQLHGFASSEKEWYPLTGTLESTG
jgi:MoaF N-terminal domain